MGGGYAAVPVEDLRCRVRRGRGPRVELPGGEAAGEYGSRLAGGPVCHVLSWPRHDDRRAKDLRCCLLDGGGLRTAAYQDDALHVHSLFLQGRYAVGQGADDALDGGAGQIPGRVVCPGDAMERTGGVGQVGRAFASK